MGALELSTAPAQEPVTVDEVMRHLRIDEADETESILDWIVVARVEAEKFMRRKIITQTWILYMDNFPSGVLELPFGNLLAVNSIQYTDDQASTFTVTASDYVVDTKHVPGRLQLATGSTWPSASLAQFNPVEINFDTGFGATPDLVPDPIKQAIKLMVGDMYENRENTIQSAFQPREISISAQALLRNYRTRIWQGIPQ